MMTKLFHKILNVPLCAAATLIEIQQLFLAQAHHSTRQEIKTSKCQKQANNMLAYFIVRLSLCP